MSFKPFWNLIHEELGANFVEDPTLQASVKRLSAAFTEGRNNLTADYLKDKVLRRAYLAYFVPLNFEKVRTLLDVHAKQVFSKDAGQLRVLDFGCGPGTASLAALAVIKEFYGAKQAVHVDLVDSQSEALELAEHLVSKFGEKLQLKITVSTKTEIDENLPKDEFYDLVLAANVLNELPAEQDSREREVLLKTWDQTRGGLLVLEPGHRVSSQRLIRFRQRLLKDPGGDFKIVGPCPHIEKCPVYRSKHWCHFSEPIQDGRLIDLNLRIFKDPRSWLKFSYVFFKRGEKHVYDKEVFRAIGDLHMSGPGKVAIDLCQPVEKYVLKLPRNLPPKLRHSLVRGARVKLDDRLTIDARPMTKREPRRERERD